jgi:creatinine amidohydrolase
MQYGELNWTQIPDLTDRVVVVPLGSLEQHGHHLPLLTDSMIGGEILHRAEQELGETAVFLPMVWFGASDHHRQFPGTISLDIDTYTLMLENILESLIGSGFHRILMLNSHGGNDLPATAALYKVQMRHRDQPDLWLVLATWFSLAGPKIAAYEALEQKYVTHASELETSMILYLAPELVRLDRAVGAHAPFDSGFYNPYSGRGSRVTVRRSFEQVSRTGAYGHPELASAEKGERLFEIAVREVVACVRDVATWDRIEPS